MTNPSNSPITFRILPFLIVAVCLTAPATAVSSPEEEGPERSPSEAAPVEVDVSGLKIVVDPKTGEVVSARTGESHVLSEALEHALSRSAEGLEVFDLPTGGMGVPLEGRFQHVMMVKVKADGSFELECVDSVRKAKGFLHPKTAGSDDVSRVR
jgi:hypothetical protein